MTSGIYKIESPSGGFYIGSAANFGQRWYSHRSQLRKGRHHNQPLQRAYNKYGLERLRFIQLLVCRPSDLLMFEQRAIDILVPPYNTCPSAGSRMGSTHSPEARAKMASNSPRRSPTKIQIEKTVQSNRTRIWSASSREKISIAMRGGKGSPGKRSVEFKEKMSAIRLGHKPINCFEKVVSEETKLEIAECYLSGLGLNTLKKRYRTKSSVIRNILVAEGLEIRRIGQRGSIRKRSVDTARAAL